MPSAPRDPVIAVDGPSGSGKSSVSRSVARALGLRYLDTGAMYRAATWAVLQDEVDPADHDAVTASVSRADIEIDDSPDAPEVRAHGQALGQVIRGDEVTAAVSAVAAVPGVRSLLIEQQRRIAAAGGIVVEGRDICAVVLPDADVKVFLTADEQARAARRQAEHRTTTVEAVQGDLARRDALDHAVNPLVRADGATEIDTTHVDQAQAVEAVLRLVRAVRA